MKPMRSKIYRFVIPALLMAGLFSFELASANGPTCSLVFSEKNSIDRTTHDLASMRISLDQAKANGTNSIELTALASDYRKKEQAMVEYLTTNKIMTRQEFSENLRQEIKRIQSKKQTNKKQDDRNKEEEEARRRKEQEEQVKNSVDIGERAVMHRVEPGRFKMGVDEPGKKIDVTLTEPFEMQATPMTQIVWIAVADLATRKFPDKYQINADPSHYKGDTHPVEMVSFDEVQTWIKALNELSAIGEPVLANLFPGHKTGDVYRLPTEEEWEFVMRGRGQYNDLYHFGSDEALLDGHAWYRENSDDQTHPVAQKKPLVINGKDFYDMHGNVSVWVQNWHPGVSSRRADPKSLAEGKLRIVRGGAYSYSALFLRSDERDGVHPATRLDQIGFRLVRTVP